MPAAALPAPKLQPLIRLLGSDNDNECLAAARGVARVLAAQGLSWHDVAIKLGRKT